MLYRLFNLKRRKLNITFQTILYQVCQHVRSAIGASKQKILYTRIRRMICRCFRSEIL